MCAPRYKLEASSQRRSDLANTICVYVCVDVVVCVDVCAPIQSSQRWDDLANTSCEPRAMDYNNSSFLIVNNSLQSKTVQ